MVTFFEVPDRYAYFIYYTNSFVTKRSTGQYGRCLAM